MRSELDNGCKPSIQVALSSKRAKNGRLTQSETRAYT